MKSTAQAHFTNFNNRKMMEQLISHFLDSVQNFPIENINWLAVRDSYNQNALVVGRWKFQDVREAHVAGNQQTFFALGKGKNKLVAFSLQTRFMYVHNVKTRVTKNAGC